jgi:hypothetical protein
VTAEIPAIGEKLATQLMVVVHLAIEHNRPVTVRRMHRLVAVFRQINNRQPPKAQRNARRIIRPHTAVVRTSMNETLRHSASRFLQALIGRRREYSRYAAHVTITPVILITI